MKKAIIDQLFLGFLLLMGVVTFVATVNDETSTRNYIYDLKALAKTSAKTMARYYESQIDMCTAQTVSTNILGQQQLGTDSLNNNLVSYTWWDSDENGEPDKVTATIAAHQHNTFWYRFLDFMNFNVGPFSWTEDVNTPANVSLTFDSEDAGYNNMMGTYQLDSNNCVVNAQLLLQNSNAGIAAGTAIGSTFTSPPTYVFLLSDGYDTFNNNGDRPKITDTITVNNHCFSNATSNPSVTLNGKTVSNTHMYFEHTELNGDGGYEHIQLIPKSVQTQYESFIAGLSGNAKEKYQQFIAQCESVNTDNDLTNDIPSDYKEGVQDCEVDKYGQYIYAMEDLDGGGDQDFNDLMLNSTRTVIPDQNNTYSVNADNSINLTCAGNSTPTLTITCPSPIDENSSVVIDYSASDSDGTIATTTLSASNGTVVNNNDGTVTYTPDSGFFGTDTLSITVQDNDGANNTQTCSITVNELNTAPVINGTPMTIVEAGSNYIFVPSASDADGDTLTFSISGKPSWATFSTSTGQLSGLPSNSDVGTYSNVIISVSDGVNSVSLPSFNITVTQNTTNSAPTCSNIANQDKKENENLYLDLNTICTDSDGDTLTFTVNTDKGLSLNIANGIIDYTIPNGATAYSPVVVTITASDSTDTASTSFTLTISDVVSCTINESEDFSSSSNGWTGGTLHSIGSPSNGYRINGKNTSAKKTYSFGTNCASQTIAFKFDYSTKDNWESGEKVELYINGSKDNSYSRTGDRTNFLSKTATIQTDTNGDIEIKFKTTSNKDGERAWIDNVELTK